MIFLYAAVILISGILGIFLAEYQDCYRNEKKYTLTGIKTHLKKSPKRFIGWFAIYVVFAVLAVVFCKQKSISAVALPQFVLFWELALMCAWIDFKVKKIPNKLLLALLAIRTVGLVAEMVSDINNAIPLLLGSFVAMLIGGAIVFVCRLMSRGGIGAGDVKLFAMIGFFFGVIPMMNILFYSLLAAALASAFLLIFKKAKLKSTIALGPFVFIGLNIYYVLM